MRQSAFKNTWDANKRPYIRVAADAYVSLQGETSVIGCGECQKKVNYNDYITGITTEASVDSPPGSASFNLSIPDNDVNQFFVDGQLIIIPMMEVEIYAKGYYMVGGIPQYYKIFWGLVSSVSQSWSNGTTTVSVSCKDILRWWELTNVTQNPAFLSGFGSSAGGYQLFQNQFAGQNPYTTIIQLARDAMGDFLLSTGSFTSYLPERGAEAGIIGSYSKDMMAYWQLKFSNIQSNLVLFGTSGQAYSFSGIQGTVSPNQISAEIFKQEYKKLQSNQSTTLLYSNNKEVATAKIELSRAGDVEFFQNDTVTKLSLALQARDQIGYEFYCDTTGDIIFKPPFYNLNTLANKPVSWINDIDILEDSITDSEAEVVTHVTSSGNAFGGVMDNGLNDEITTPRTGVYDYHLLKRYGWRRADLQLEWAGNPRKLFFHILDWMDRLNSKRQYGTVTVPLRPELRMGFPVWIPKYDSFFYIQGISHSYSPGADATTTLTLTAKRSKFIAPKNIGIIKKTGTRTVTSVNENGKAGPKVEDDSYSVTFPGDVGSSSGQDQLVTSNGGPAIIRDPKTGKLLGYPNVVMVYRSTYDGTVLARVLEAKGSSKSKNAGGKQKSSEGTPNDYNNVVRDVLKEFVYGDKEKLISRIRAHRYEAGMTNMGAYDYAYDESRKFKELTLIPANYIAWGTGTDGGPDNNRKLFSTPDGQIATAGVVTSDKTDQERRKALDVEIKKTSEDLKKKQKVVKDLSSKLSKLEKQLQALKQKHGKLVPNPKKPPSKNDLTDYIINNLENKNVDAKITTSLEEYEKLGGDNNPNIAYIPIEVYEFDDSPPEEKKLKDIIKLTKAEFDKATKEASEIEAKNKELTSQNSSLSIIPSLNILVRPVSDEFGFEVIGHYRYGRSAFIDRGKLQVKDGDKLVNRLTIPFSPTSGLLTEPSRINGIDSLNFSQQFEEMVPEDYITGASFTGTTGDAISGIKLTSAQTYTNLVNANKGVGLYIEADATRKARQLEEMEPTINKGEFSAAFAGNKCSCGIGRTSWYTLLPSTLIEKIISQSSGKSAGSSDKTVTSTLEGSPELISKEEAQRQIDELNSPEGLAATTTPDTKLIWDQKYSLYSSILKADPKKPIERNVLLTNITSDGFFGELEKFLKNTFMKNYDEYNSKREEKFTAGDLDIQVPFEPYTQVDNTLPDPKNPLFNRASLGDPDAIRALQNEANFQFGLTKNALSNFKETTSSAQEKARTSFDGGVSVRGPTVQVTTNPPRTQPQPASSPTLADPINPTKFNSAGSNLEFVPRGSL